MSSQTVSVLRLGHFGPWRRAEEGKKACQLEKKILNRMSNTGHTAPKRKVIPHVWHLVEESVIYLGLLGCSIWQL